MSGDFFVVVWSFLWVDDLMTPVAGCTLLFPWSQQALWCPPSLAFRRLHGTGKPVLGDKASAGAEQCSGVRLCVAHAGWGAPTAAQGQGWSSCVSPAPKPLLAFWRGTPPRSPRKAQPEPWSRNATEGNFCCPPAALLGIGVVVSQGASGELCTGHPWVPLHPSGKHLSPSWGVGFTQHAVVLQQA